MKKIDLIKLLEKLQAEAANDGDWEDLHMQADKALLEYINVPEISAAFEALPRWYA
jgi:hypothetical protein